MVSVRKRWSMVNPTPGTVPASAPRTTSARQKPKMSTYAKTSSTVVHRLDSTIRGDILSAERFGAPSDVVSELGISGSFLLVG